MSNQSHPAPAQTASPELAALFQQLQQSTFRATLGGVFVLGILGGVALPDSDSFIRRLFISLALFGIGLLAWTLHRWRPVAGIVAPRHPRRRRDQQDRERGRARHGH